MNDLGMDRLDAGLTLAIMLGGGWAIAFGLALLGDRLERWWRERS